MGYYYNELKTRKESGEKLGLESLNYEGLKRLWWDEALPDVIIAELFDVDKTDVRCLRYRFDIKQTTMRAMEIENYVNQYVKSNNEHHRIDIEYYQKQIEGLTKRIQELEKK